MGEAQVKCNFDETVSLSSLKPHPRNRNNHTDEQIKRLSELFEYHGIRHPIIVSKRSGYIVAGHARLSAAKLLKLESFPVEYQDFESDETEYAFLVADNAIALWAELDMAGINADLPDLGPDFSLDMLGIKDFTLDANFAPGTIDEQGELDKKKPVTCPNCGESFVAP